ncbi:MAG: hypothetical protein GY874_10660 [Desulfobacteraceae bacterium]|nr:hypothetical protein [Desulfobacteraceae bacterium]
MMRKKLNLKKADGFLLWAIMYCAFIVLAAANKGFCEEVSIDVAKKVAESKIAQHISLYGDWNGSSSPVISTWEKVMRNDVFVAYNFSVEPSGHLLIAADDALSPVLLYSSSSAFYPLNEKRPDAIEAWVVPQLYQNVEGLFAQRLAIKTSMRSSGSHSDESRIAKAWSQYTDTGFSRRSVMRNQNYVTTVAGPLLTTKWGQGFPYNKYTPDDGCPSRHTLSGCVAIAWAQLLRYWSWPETGEGESSYLWEGLTQSVDFSKTVYDWENMPDELILGKSTIEEMNAVAELIYHMGVAAQMHFGCYGSASTQWAYEILSKHFKYKDSLQYYNRDDYPCSHKWFELFKTELDADPPRPVVFAILSVQQSGHKVLVDGYQTDENADLIHINYGWNGNYNGFYNISANFSCGRYTWSTDNQMIVTGIEPDNAAPEVDAGYDIYADELTSVKLEGNAHDPEMIGIASFKWTQISGDQVNLSDADTLNPTFTAPEVDSDSELVFQLRADDKNRAFDVDTCTVIVIDTDSGDSSYTDDTGTGDTEDTEDNSDGADNTQKNDNETDEAGSDNESPPSSLVDNSSAQDLNSGSGSSDASSSGYHIACFISALLGG